jgi:NAD(P)H-hydrate epimerase
LLGDRFALTPHPGEAGMLLDCSARKVQADRVAALFALADRYPGGWILLKGYRALIIGPDKIWHVCGTGNPALATAGSGDALAGMIGALAAQDYSMEDAVIFAALRHGLAADHWVAEGRPAHAMIAEDIIKDLERPGPLGDAR